MSEQATVAVSLIVNGRRISKPVEARTTLVDFLRDAVGLTGTHVGCEHGVCGACSVLLDGDPVRACCLFAVQVNEQSVTTVEGLSQASGELSVLQDAFCEKHALQCGYCTSGMLIACEALLRKDANPTDERIREAIGSNLCRCTGYEQIVQAVRYAVDRAAATSEVPGD